MYNPGSPEAVAKGCTCDAHDNHDGKGIIIGNHEPIFWKNEWCVIHGTLYSISDLSKAMEASYGKSI